MKLPIFYENSRVPCWLEKVSPIEPYAVSFGIWVWCKGTLSETLRTHETIHYLSFWLLLLVLCKGDGAEAYRRNPFELEAYDKQGDKEYPLTRSPYAWTGYVRQAFSRRT
jgi:hypothetical protein